MENGTRESKRSNFRWSRSAFQAAAARAKVVDTPDVAPSDAELVPQPSPPSTSDEPASPLPSLPPRPRCANLVVHAEHGAGIEVSFVQNRGYVVEAINDEPGQPGLHIGDIIIRVNGCSLALASEDDADDVLASEIANDVEILVVGSTISIAAGDVGLPPSESSLPEAAPATCVNMAAAASTEAVPIPFYYESEDVSPLNPLETTPGTYATVAEGEVKACNIAPATAALAASEASSDITTATTTEGRTQEAKQDSDASHANTHMTVADTVVALPSLPQESFSAGDENLEMSAEQEGTKVQDERPLTATATSTISMAAGAECNEMAAGQTVETDVTQSVSPSTVRDSGQARTRDRCFLDKVMPELDGSHGVDTIVEAVECAHASENSQAVCGGVGTVSAEHTEAREETSADESLTSGSLPVSDVTGVGDKAVGASATHSAASWLLWPWLRSERKIPVSAAEVKAEAAARAVEPHDRSPSRSPPPAPPPSMVPSSASLPARLEADQPEEKVESNREAAVEITANADDLCEVSEAASADGAVQPQDPSKMAQQKVEEKEKEIREVVDVRRNEEKETEDEEQESEPEDVVFNVRHREDTVSASSILRTAPSSNAAGDDDEALVACDDGTCTAEAANANIPAVVCQRGDGRWSTTSASPTTETEANSTAARWLLDDTDPGVDSCALVSDVVEKDEVTVDFVAAIPGEEAPPSHVEPPLPRLLVSSASFGIDVESRTPAGSVGRREDGLEPENEAVAELRQTRGSGKLGSPPPSTVPPPSCKVVGLEPWLAEMSLQDYQTQATQWCVDMGAVSLEEVAENIEDFGADISLRPIERQRIRKWATRTLEASGSCEQGQSLPEREPRTHDWGKAPVCNATSAYGAGHPDSATESAWNQAVPAAPAGGASVGVSTAASAVYRSRSVRLAMDSSGNTGLGLCWSEEWGILVETVDPLPGQPSLSAGDLIVAIEGNSLRHRTHEECDALFVEHLQDGALLNVLTPSTAEDGTSSPSASAPRGRGRGAALAALASQTAPSRGWKLSGRGRRSGYDPNRMWTRFRGPAW
eukprot:TRINITY_DN74002_c0_g1_i1.p1 TRINITY_DN74002_c0_g1~~TRINITY_DN74002_c0_g1_i1.p1  ORF type:complete len:1055 (+),score=195.10 TRINITY_DN74002_c0_g1_i1:68-3232(+)